MPAIWFWYKTNLSQLLTYFVSLIPIPIKCQYVLNGVCDDPSKLKSLCKTRWLHRIDAFHIFVELFDGIVKAFNEMTSNPSKWSRDSSVDAMSMHCLWHISFEFCLTLRILERHMSYTESLTLALQVKAVDIVQGVEHVSTLKNVLSDARSHIDTILCYVRESIKACSDLQSRTTNSTEMC